MTGGRQSAFADLTFWLTSWKGAIAQLGERVLCKHEVVGSIPSGSTRQRRQPLGFQPLGYPLAISGASSDNKVSRSRAWVFTFARGKRVISHRKEEIHPIAPAFFSPGKRFSQWA